MKSYWLVVCCVAVIIIQYTSAELNNLNESSKNAANLGNQLVEQGRTLVHHAVKRFMIILPAIFFKLGIAFTLLILVALVAVNNGFIGFLILVVGLSSVLARLQDSRRSALAVPYIAPPYYHHQPIWDRSDSGLIQNGYPSPTLQYKPDYNNYHTKYTATKM